MVLTPAKDSIDVGLLVEDIKKSLAFYQGTLGLEKIEEVQMPFGTFHRLRYGTSDVKLLDSKTIPPADPLRLRPQPGGRSWTLITFEIQNISSLCSVLKEKGVEFFVPETQIRPGARIALLKDPMGTLLSSSNEGDDALPERKTSVIARSESKVEGKWVELAVHHSTIPAGD